MIPIAVWLFQAVSPTPRTAAVQVPRVADAEVVVDGRLDEPVWARAAELRGFSQYLPNDNRPADDSTVVLVWYSPGAIYFGIRAYQDSSGVRATLADRDKITGDDYVQILLDTYNDRRQAFVFGVNPLGVQADGTLQDAARQIANITSSTVTGAYALDLSPDFVYQSRGRLTAWGYEVEIRIPFKTLRYQSSDPQDWGINVIRIEQSRGHQDTWAPVLQTRSSFLAQSGELAGLTGLSRGVVLDLTPEVTGSVTGAASPSGWRYRGGDPQPGLTARWGATPNLTLSATAHPDFSQVEADVPQLQLDPRAALFFPEKRPFFLDGLELFQTPFRLIYSRRLVDPAAAFKAVGKVGATTLALLSGVDGRDASATRADNPILSALRVRQDLGGSNSVGLVLTDREDGGAANRVAALDGVMRAGAWTLTSQAGASATRDSIAGASSWSPIWNVDVARSGRRFGLDVKTTAVGDDFHVLSGLVSHVDYATTAVIPSVTVVGRPGALLESFTANTYLSLTWNRFRSFTGGQAADQWQNDMSAGFTFRGGWQVGVGVSLESFGYPPTLYSNYRVERRSGTTVDTVPFTGQPSIPNFDLGLNLQTPRFQSFSLTGFLLWGHDENFYEWAPGTIILGTLDVTWRPTGKARAELIYNHQQVHRRDDGSQVALIRIPQVRLEYQVARPLFIRLIGSYNASDVDSLRDDGRTNGTILLKDPVTGAFTRSARATTSSLRLDWLVSYRPTPGTVIFAGYGSSFANAQRTSDGFFIKVSYVIRA